MAGIIPNAGELYILDRLTSAGLTLRLYKNNYDPVAGSVAANFTEADFTGYAARTVNSWPAATTNGSSKAESTHPAQTWTNTGGSQTIYGYYLTNAAGTVVAAEKFASSQTLATNDPIVVAPTLTIVSE